MSRKVRYFGPHREPAVLVEDFGELREGVIIYDIACTACHRSACRGVLVALLETEAPGLSGICNGYSWELLPPCYDAEAGHFSGLDHEMVASRRIWRVIDEPLAKAESRARRRKLVTS